VICGSIGGELRIVDLLLFYVGYSIEQDE